MIVLNEKIATTLNELLPFFVQWVDPICVDPTDGEVFYHCRDLSDFGKAPATKEAVSRPGRW